MKINGEDLSNIEKNVNEIEYYNSLTKIFKKNLIIIIIVLILLMKGKSIVIHLVIYIN